MVNIDPDLSINSLPPSSPQLDGVYLLTGLFLLLFVPVTLIDHRDISERLILSQTSPGFYVSAVRVF